MQTEQNTQTMTFRYQIKESWNLKPSVYGWYETVFLDKNKKWRSVHIDKQNTYPLKAQFKERKEVPSNPIFTTETACYNYYEYEIDTKQLLENPTSSRLLLYYYLLCKSNHRCIKLSHENDQYKNANKSPMERYAGNLDFYGGVGYQSFVVELAILFPKLYEQLPEKRMDILDTFGFVLTSLQKEIMPTVLIASPKNPNSSKLSITLV